MSEPSIVVRPYDEPLDSGFCVYFWLASWAWSFDGKCLGAQEDGRALAARKLGVPISSVKDDPSPRRRAWWDAHTPYVQKLLRSSQTLVACTKQNADAVIGFACLGDDVVQYAYVKRKWHEEKLAEDIYRMLLGDRLDQPQLYAHELVDMGKCMTLPREWRMDRYYNARRALEAA